MSYLVRDSELNVIEVAIAYVIDVGRYAESLSRHKVGVNAAVGGSLV